MKQVILVIFVFVITVTPAMAQTPEPDSINIQPYDYDDGASFLDPLDTFLSNTFVSIFGSVAATILSIVGNANIGGYRMLVALVIIIIVLLAIKWMYGRVVDRNIGDLPGSHASYLDGGAETNNSTVVYNDNPYRVVNTNDPNVKIMKR